MPTAAINRMEMLYLFDINALGIPITANVPYAVFGLLLLSPMIAAAAMRFGSVSVAGNALRLRSLDLSAFSDRRPNYRPR